MSDSGNPKFNSYNLAIATADLWTASCPCKMAPLCGHFYSRILKLSKKIRQMISYVKLFFPIVDQECRFQVLKQQWPSPSELRVNFTYSDTFLPALPVLQHLLLLGTIGVDSSFIRGREYSQNVPEFWTWMVEHYMKISLRVRFRSKVNGCNTHRARSFFFRRGIVFLLRFNADNFLQYTCSIVQGQSITRMPWTC